jgi:dihydropyrimidinase
VIDADGVYVTSGGVDSHVYLAQDNAPHWQWLAHVLSLRSRRREYDESLFPVLEEHHRRSRGQSYIDYGFHFILSHRSERILAEELPVIVEGDGISSIKLYMKSVPLKLGDGEMLEVMMRTRELGMTTVGACGE